MIKELTQKDYTKLFDMFDSKITSLGHYYKVFRLSKDLAPKKYKTHSQFKQEKIHKNDYIVHYTIRDCRSLEFLKSRTACLSKLFRNGHYYYFLSIHKVGDCPFKK